MDVANKGVHNMLSCYYYRVSVFCLFGGSGTMSSEDPCLRGERRGAQAGLVCCLQELASESLKYRREHTIFTTVITFVNYTVAGPQA